MNRFLKILMQFLMIFVFVLPICAQSELSVTVKPFSEGFYVLTAKATSSTLINTAEVFISYDNTVVVPVDGIFLEDVAVKQSELQGSTAPFESEMGIAPVRWLINESRTAFKITVYSVDGIDASRGAELFRFTFRVKAGEKIARDTFRVEKSHSEESFLSAVYRGDDANSGAGIFIGGDVYGATDGRGDTVLFTKPDITHVADLDKILVGDANQDGNVNITDAILLLQRLASSAIHFTNNQLKASDCVLNGSLDVSDVILLLQYLASDEIEFD